jgi:ferredoxin-NADP reductase
MGSGGFYDITIKEKQDGFLTPYIWDQWGEGTKVESSGPHGFFYYEPLRDERQIVGLAGGAGITPFHSMAREIAYGDLDVELLVLHGSAEEDDIIFYDEFKQLEKETNGKVQIVHVLSCAEVSLAGCEQGFITTDIVEKYANIDRSSVFICGPAAMHSFADQELAPFNLPHRRVRRESLGQIEDVAQLPGYPKDIAGETFRLVVRVGGEVVDIPAMAAETVLVAVERANLAPPSRCRSGECGFCRSRLISGEVYVNPDGDGRRGADRQFGYIHPCSSYPTSDLEIEVL